MYSKPSPGANAAPRRWSRLTASGVVAGISRRLCATKAPAITDQVPAWAAASPAMYRASSSAKAASKSSRSNTTTRHDPLVGIDLDDVEGIVLNRPGVTARHANSDECEAFAAGCQDAHHRHREADIDGRLRIFDVGISTMQDSGVHHPPTIVDGNVLGRSLEPRRPSRRPRCTKRSALHARVALFSSRGVGRLSWSNLAIAASRSATSKTSQRLTKSPSTVMRLITPPLGVEALV